ncbi:Mrp/NBP35 family ATP-binding protein [Leptolinea tardivitalis]|uniref:Iron-sulfur cluster carrier protein n=1 Tax=Leptolinea tardivitalis TaxID=229920 RepID=A0A0P6X462_9CHLR|nr:Mrp/NBP35 family ATP-binding protein [Leptolinea tardivitalis]KPL74655.1 chromosome partitioning protein [Leptolinea tardivitalis]GAP23003.1 ATPase [Leptolinea tardivitalis]
MTITKENVLAALSTVQEPELHRDLVSLNMIKDISIDGGNISFTVELTTPACPLRGRIQNEAKDAVMRLPGVVNVNVKLDSRVVSDGRDRGVLGLSVKNAVAVASGKGGVGKSTVSVNLAIALAKTGARVGLLDADIYGPNVPTMMGIDHLPPALGEKMLPAEVYGVKLMSIGFLVKPGQPLIWRGPMLHSAIRQFLTDVEWGDLDYLIIDLPPGTGDAQLSLAQSLALSGAVIVTLPQAVSLEDASRGLQMFKVLNVPILGVVENMSYLELPDGTRVDVFGNGGGETLAKESDVPFLGTIPMDPDVRKGGDGGTPVVVSLPDSASGKAFIDIAGKVAASLSIAAKTENSGLTIKMVE